MTTTVERFSNRVENYSKYRPGYPPEMLEFFRNELGLTRDSIVADIGSGTGLSAKPILENGNLVYGVEPNAGMREAAEEFLRGLNKFRSVNGTADQTTLENGSIDFVVAAQAFHWFEPEPTRREFKRILKPGGYAALIWNERQLDTTPFLSEYEQLLIKYATDYAQVRHDALTDERVGTFFNRAFEKQTFPNEQVLDLEGLKGRVLSSSYMPSETDQAYVPLMEELRALFAKHASSGKIVILYDTNVFYTQL